MLGSTYQANLQLIQTAGKVVIRHEIMNGIRIVPVCPGTIPSASDVSQPHVSVRTRTTIRAP